MARSPKIGDCYLIPLSDGRQGYCQYVQWNEQMGCLIRVFDRITATPILAVEELTNAADLFGPVFVGLYPPVRKDRWKLIGRLPVRQFRFPKFRDTNAIAFGTYDDWSIWDGCSDQRIGKLPEALRSLERKMVWGDEGLEERIQTGVDPFAGVQ